MKRKFKVLYTHQKTKKKKTWQDGYLTLTIDEKRGFLTDEEKRNISTVYLNKKNVECGSALESDKYLIQVDDEIMSDSPQLSQQEKVVTVTKHQETPVTYSQNSQTVVKKSRGFSVPRKVVTHIPVPEVASAKFQPISAPVKVPEKSIWNEVLPLTEETTNLVNEGVNIGSNLRGTQDVLKMLGCTGPVNSVLKEVSSNVDPHVSDHNTQDSGLSDFFEELSDFSSLKPATEIGAKTCLLLRHDTESERSGKDGGSVQEEVVQGIDLTHTVCQEISLDLNEPKNCQNLNKLEKTNNRICEEIDLRKEIVDENLVEAENGTVLRYNEVTEDVKLADHLEKDGNLRECVNVDVRAEGVGGVLINELKTVDGNVEIDSSEFTEQITQCVESMLDQVKKYLQAVSLKNESCNGIKAEENVQHILSMNVNHPSSETYPQSNKLIEARPGISQSEAENLKVNDIAELPDVAWPIKHDNKKKNNANTDKLIPRETELRSVVQEDQTLDLLNTKSTEFLSVKNKSENSVKMESNVESFQSKFTSSDNLDEEIMSKIDMVCSRPLVNNKHVQNRLTVKTSDHLTRQGFELENLGNKSSKEIKFCNKKGQYDTDNQCSKRENNIKDQSSRDNKNLKNVDENEEADIFGLDFNLGFSQSPNKSENQNNKQGNSLPSPAGSFQLKGACPASTNTNQVVPTLFETYSQDEDMDFFNDFSDIDVKLMKNLFDSDSSPLIETETQGITKQEKYKKQPKIVHRNLFSQQQQPKHHFRPTEQNFSKLHSHSTPSNQRQFTQPLCRPNLKKPRMTLPNNPEVDLCYPYSYIGSSSPYKSLNTNSVSTPQSPDYVHTFTSNTKPSNFHLPSKPKSAPQFSPVVSNPTHLENLDMNHAKALLAIKGVVGSVASKNPHIMKSSTLTKKTSASNTPVNMIIGQAASNVDLLKHRPLKGIENSQPDLFNENDNPSQLDYYDASKLPGIDSTSQPSHDINSTSFSVCQGSDTFNTTIDDNYFDPFFNTAGHFNAADRSAEDFSLFPSFPQSPGENKLTSKWNKFIHSAPYTHHTQKLHKKWVENVVQIEKVQASQIKNTQQQIYSTQPIPMFEQNPSLPPTQTYPAFNINEMCDVTDNILYNNTPKQSQLFGQSICNTALDIDEDFFDKF